ncbi:hypothetical protein NIES4101_43570 [Calothrix sp. NIES-4101]|nr:hypothetical protein NIES4101_43570 [Calothrix sp. NIES-4101]
MLEIYSGLRFFWGNSPNIRQDESVDFYIREFNGDYRNKKLAMKEIRGIYPNTAQLSLKS